MSFIKLTFLAALMAIAGLSCSQLPGGGGGVNSNPYNPQNWNCEYEVTYNGTTTYEGWRAVSPQAYEAYTQVYDWGDPIGPYDDAAYNESPDFHTIKATAFGTVTKKIKWIGIGPAPEYTFVRVNANVEVSTPNQRIDSKVSNGLDHPETEFGLNGVSSGKRASGFRMRKLLINPNNGVSEPITLEQSGRIEASTVLGAAHVHAPNMTIVVEDKVAGVQEYNFPNHKKAYDLYGNSERVWVPNKWIDNIEIFTCMQLDEGQANDPASGFFTQAIGPVLFGWPNGVDIQMSPTVNQYTAYINKHFSRDQLIDMISSGNSHDELVTINAFDAYSNRNGQAIIHVFTPLSGKNLISNEIVAIGKPYIVSNQKHFEIGETKVIEATPITITATVSSSVSVSGGLELGLKIQEIVGIAASGNVSFELGASASVSFTIANNETHTNSNAFPVNAHLERQPLGRKIITTFDRYDSNGYLRKEQVIVNTFRSLNAAMAAAQDYEDKVVEVPIE